MATKTSLGYENGKIKAIGSTDVLDVAGSIQVAGDLTVQGSTISSQSETVFFADSTLLLNSGDHSSSAVSGGLAILTNVQTSLAYNGYTASTRTVAIDSSAGDLSSGGSAADAEKFSAGDYIALGGSGTTAAYKLIFEVESSSYDSVSGVTSVVLKATPSTGAAASWLSDAPDADIDDAASQFCGRALVSVLHATGSGTFKIGESADKDDLTGLETIAVIGDIPTTSEIRANFSAGEGIDLSAGGVISGEDASTSNKGIASFSSDNFAVTSGAVTIKDGGIANAELANSVISVTDGTNSTDVSLGGSITFAAGSGITVSESSGTITVTNSAPDTVRTVTAGGNTLADSETLAFTAGTNVSITENGGAVTISSTDTQLSQVQVEDIVGAMLDGTETRITVSYDTTDNNLDFVVDGDLSNYDNTTSAFITASSSDTLTNKSFNANGTGNSISNLEVDDFASSAICTESDDIASNDSDSQIPTAAAVKDYVDREVNASSESSKFTATGEGFINKTFEAGENLSAGDFVCISTTSAGEVLKAQADDAALDAVIGMCLATANAGTAGTAQNSQLKISSPSNGSGAVGISGNFLFTVDADGAGGTENFTITLNSGNAGSNTNSPFGTGTTATIYTGGLTDNQAVLNAIKSAFSTATGDKFEGWSISNVGSVGNNNDGFNVTAPSGNSSYDFSNVTASLGNPGEIFGQKADYSSGTPTAGDSVEIALPGCQVQVSNNFASGDLGQEVYLQDGSNNKGQISTSPPTNSGSAVVRVGYVTDTGNGTSKILFLPQFIMEV